MYYYFKISYRIYKNSSYLKFCYVLSYLELAQLISYEYVKHKENFVIDFVGPVRYRGVRK